MFKLDHERIIEVDEKLGLWGSNMRLCVIMHKILHNGCRYHTDAVYQTTGP